jgi:hypothetical protein
MNEHLELMRVCVLYICGAGVHRSVYSLGYYWLDDRESVLERGNNGIFVFATGSWTHLASCPTVVSLMVSSNTPRPPIFIRSHFAYHEYKTRAYTEIAWCSSDFSTLYFLGAANGRTHFCLRNLSVFIYDLLHWPRRNNTPHRGPPSTNVWNTKLRIECHTNVCTYCFLSCRVNYPNI